MFDDFSEGNDPTLKHGVVVSNEERGKIMSQRMMEQGMGKSKKKKDGTTKISTNHTQSNR
jgi:predicted GNAT family N-acyltransferase